MVKGALDSTHTVVVKTENRGIRVVIGLLAVILLVKWWLTGSVLNAVACAMPAEGGEVEFKSVTGALLPIFIDLLWFIGSVVVFAVTNLAGVLWDVGSGIFETIRTYAARNAAVEAATNAATEAGTKAAETNAGAIASTAAVDAAEKAAEKPAEPAKPPARRVDVTKLVNTLNEHEAKLDAARQALDAFDGRLKFSEDMLQSLNGWSQKAELRFNEYEDLYQKRADRISQIGETVLNTIAKLEEEAKTRHADDVGLAEAIGDLKKRLESLEATPAPEQAPNDTPAKPPKPAYRRATRQTPVSRKSTSKAKAR